MGAVPGHLLDGDPAVRWQVLRDLTDTTAEEVAAERANVATEGWRARLLAQQRADGSWDGGACRPDRVPKDRAGFDVWSATHPSLELLLEFGVDPQAPAVRRAVGHTGEIVDPRFAMPSFPTRWYHDVLRALDHLRLARPEGDARCAEAVELIRAERLPNGLRTIENTCGGAMQFPLDEEPEGSASRWITLRALRVLRWWDRRSTNAQTASSSHDTVPESSTSTP